MNCPFCKAPVFLKDIDVQDHSDDESIAISFGCFRCHKEFEATVTPTDFKEVK